VISDRDRGILIASLVFGGACIGCAFLIRSMWSIWSFKLGISRSESVYRRPALGATSGISVRILDTKEYASPIAVIPGSSFNGFWQLLHVDANDWNNFHLERRRGNRVPIAPKFPLLSELADIVIENIPFPADQIDELRAEIDAVEETQVGHYQNRVLLALSKAAIIASAEKKGLILSPFG
jgi:hypothetical protein